MNIPKPPKRQRKERKPLRRSPIKSGARCKYCRGTGTVLYGKRPNWHPEPCDQCNGKGRIASKPLKRSSKPKKHVDHATPDFKLLNRIWSGYENLRHCALTGTEVLEITNFGEIDYHHHCGRGRGEKIFSSPYAVIPILRSIHVSGIVNQPEFRAALIRKTRETVDRAIDRGIYNPTSAERDRDAAFREYSEQFLPYFEI